MSKSVRRDVDDVLDGVEEFDGGGTHVLDVLDHAAAVVDHEPEMERRGAGRLAAGEELDLLRRTLFDDLEVVGGEPEHRRPAPVGDHHAEVHEIDAGPEYLLPARQARRCNQKRRHNAEPMHRALRPASQNTLYALTRMT